MTALAAVGQCLTTLMMVRLNSPVVKRLADELASAARRFIGMSYCVTIIAGEKNFAASEQC